MQGPFPLFFEHGRDRRATVCQLNPGPRKVSEAWRAEDIKALAMATLLEDETGPTHLPRFYCGTPKYTQRGASFIFSFHKSAFENS